MRQSDVEEEPVEATRKISRLMSHPRAGKGSWEQPRVTEVAAEETGPGAPSGLEAPIVKVISVEVKVGLERGVLLQRWQQEGGESQVVQEQDGDDIGFLGALHQGGPGWRGD